MTRRAREITLALLLAPVAAAGPALAPQEVESPVAPAATEAVVESTRGPDALDVESTRLVREYTTDPRFLTAWVDHVPEHPDVPSPREFLGYVVGTPGKLTQAEQVNQYFRELARTSPRVKVFPIGLSDNGREAIVAAISDSENLEVLASIQNFNRLLHDPRRGEAVLVEEFAPKMPVTYLVTAGLHSPETGPPEMVMELAYRLAVSEQPLAREIRFGVVTLIVPVLEMDGRARQVDWYYRHLTEVTDRDDAPPLAPPFWGDYTYHDNNRDGIQLSQPVTRALTDAYHRFLPQVALDLHESLPLLYVSLGTGPYNPALDPVTIGEWQWMASYDVQQATSLGLRGVWTWGFYTGWYPGFLIWIANNHNGVGRFYETFGNSLPGTFERNLRRAEFADERVEVRTWYRAWPPEQELRWSLRNNTNYMQTGVLASLQLAARNRETIHRNAWQKGVNALERGRSEAPFAYHVPAAQRDPGALAELLRLLDGHRVEVHRALAAATLGEREIAVGDYLVRMDQPYRNLALTLLGRQEFPSDAEHPPYDDVSWSLELMLGLELASIDDAAVLALEVERVEGVPALGGAVEEGERWIVDHRAQLGLAGLCYALEGAQVSALAEPWESHPAGSLVISGLARDALGELARRFHLDVAALSPEADPSTLAISLPRLALYHCWDYTQDSGWARFTLEQLGVPFETIDKDDLREGGLDARFDVVLVPETRSLALKDFVHGIERRWSPLAYTQTDEFPSHGTPLSSPDITGGMGFEGLAELERFVEEGGMLVTLGGAGVLAADSGIAPEVSSKPASGNPGSHVTAKVLRPDHPIAWGFPEIAHLFQGNVRGFGVPDRWYGRTVLQLGTQTLAEAERAADREAGLEVEDPEEPPAAEGEKPAPKPKLCLSGGLPRPAAFERLPAILDVQVGSGRCVLFGWNPMHRHQNLHDFGFLANALLFREHFPAMPTEDEMRALEKR